MKLEYVGSVQQDIYFQIIVMGFKCGVFIGQNYIILVKYFL